MGTIWRGADWIWERFGGWGVWGVGGYNGLVSTSWGRFTLRSEGKREPPLQLSDLPAAVVGQLISFVSFFFDPFYHSYSMHPDEKMIFLFCEAHCYECESFFKANSFVLKIPYLMYN